MDLCLSPQLQSDDPPLVPYIVWLLYLPIILAYILGKFCQLQETSPVTSWTHLSCSAVTGAMGYFYY